MNAKDIFHVFLPKHLLAGDDSVNIFIWKPESLIWKHMCQVLNSFFNLNSPCPPHRLLRLFKDFQPIC